MSLPPMFALRKSCGKGRRAVKTRFANLGDRGSSRGKDTLRGLIRELLLPSQN
jgi:hypothetical protein